MSAVVQTPELWIRPMTAQDLEQIMHIELAMYPFPWTRRIFEDCLRVGYRCHVGEVEGNLAGYGVMSTGASEAHVLNLCVAGEFQRRGLAREMLSLLLDEADKLEVRDVFLEVRPSNIAAITLYEQMGFNQVGLRKDYYPAEEGREDAIIFATSLRL
ncbi:MAG: ribosomal protein S18-alanine N-acetyltransferase [Gammaproteobacteria bacterium]|nr:ribosomal protein S18-alanine N-acetyltransferase [Gammaproteobacteria bacterium]MCF6261234.1 ribosomal protein S18-alanine N-acetyltransferase [Gammaproteobacteria bacterium]